MGEIRFVHDDIEGELRFRTPRWAEFAAWWDSISRGSASDAAHNLVAGCAIAPDANALAAEFEDGLGFLPAAIADRLLDHVGAPEDGFGKRYPVVTLQEAEEARAQASALDAQITALPDTGHEEQLRPLLAARAALEDKLIAPEIVAAAKKGTKRAPLFVRVPTGVWAFRAPGARAGGAYTDAVAAFRGGRGGASLAEASRLLVLSCVLSPSAEVAAAQIQEHPHIVYTLADALCEAGGGAGKGLRGA